MAEFKNTDTAKWDADEVRRQAPAAKKKPKKKKMHWSLRILCYIVGVAVTSCLLAGVGWLAVNDVCALNKAPLTTVVEVTEGDSVGDVAGKLKDAGLIDSRLLFTLVGSILHADDYIQPGVYELDTDMDFNCLIKSMHNYDLDDVDTSGWVRVVVPEGKTVNEIIDILVEAGVSTREELEEACANFDFQGYDFLPEELKGQVNRMEGFLFPTTQDFDPEKSAVYDIDTMLNNFVNQLSDEVLADIEKSGHSLYEIVTMASIIEKEGIGDEEERKNIASVLYNRINTTNRETYGYLQMDSTIYYAMSLAGMDKSEFSVEMDSPYNTYQHPGLPVGPICCPGLDSILAAVYPNDTDYYYFAAGKDGVSHFFQSYDEHLSFVNSDMYQPD